MGYVSHHAIVVTSLESLTPKAHAMATEIGLTITPVIKSPVNGYSSFLVVPDGSKEGWGESHEGDKLRGMFKNWLDEQRYDDNSNSYSWVEINYGSDDHGCSVTDHGWKHKLGGDPIMADHDGWDGIK